MRWWIIGRGMLGRDVEKELDSRDIPFVSTDLELDITDFSSLEHFLANNQISVIVNCAAYTQVDRAEEEQALAWKVNAHGPRNLARLAAIWKLPFVHISTDYVFDGTALEPISEKTTPNPLGTYGRSKRLGEILVQRENENALILRTSWLFGSRGKCFVSIMLRLFAERNKLGIVADQFGSPTWTRDLSGGLCDLVLSMAEPGVYHFGGEGKTSWYEFALGIRDQAFEKGMISATPTIKPLETVEYPTPAKRPAYSLLDNGKVAKALKRSPMLWKDSLGKCLEEMKV